eukprot:maker-scaffold_26-snap-gene-4.2-mRNA-1 protein AED:0.14 eAED:0.14 QI:154/1/1/1/0.5/0.33/3/84/194
MGRYAHEPENPGKTAKARVTNLRTHFKKMYEVGNSIRHLKLTKAKKYLNNVLNFDEAIPVKRFTGGNSHHSQGKNCKAPSGVIWPVKSVKFMLTLLQNLEANAESKGLDVDKLVLSHVVVQRARKLRRRTHRAHGRINAYLCSPCHVELVATERDDVVVKEKLEGEKPQYFVNRRKAAIMRQKGTVPVGGGVEE